MSPGGRGRRWLEATGRFIVLIVSAGRSGSSWGRPVPSVRGVDPPGRALGPRPRRPSTARCLERLNTAAATGRPGRMRRSAGSEGAGCTGRGSGAGNGDHPRRPQRRRPGRGRTDPRRGLNGSSPGGPISTRVATRFASTMRCCSCDMCPCCNSVLSPVLSSGIARQACRERSTGDPQLANSPAGWSRRITDGRGRGSKPSAARSVVEVGRCRSS